MTGQLIDLGYWYVISTVCTWGQYNIMQAIVYVDSCDATGGGVSFSGGYVYYSDAYVFDSATGTYTLTNPSSRYISGSSGIENATQYTTGKYWMIGGSSKAAMYYSSSGSSSSTLYYESKYTAAQSGTVDAKGTYIADVTDSGSISTYPEDGAQSGYWYQYKDV